MFDTAEPQSKNSYSKHFSTGIADSKDGVINPLDTELSSLKHETYDCRGEPIKSMAVMVADIDHNSSQTDLNS